MGLFDNIANQMNPRNDATDLAIILDNREQEQQAEEYAFGRTLELDQMFYNEKDITQNEFRDTGKVPEYFNGDADAYQEYLKGFDRRNAIDEGTYAITPEDVLKINGKEAFFDYINLTGLGSDFLGAGKRLDETNTEIYTDENGDLAIRPMVRTVDAASGDVRTNGLTRSGRNQRDLDAEGGEALVNEETVQGMKISSLNKLMRDHKATKARNAGIDTNLRFFNESDADTLYNPNADRADKIAALEKEAAAAQEGVTTAEAALETAKTAPKTIEDNVVNYGAGYGIKEDGSLPMGEELAGLLFTEEDRKEPIEGTETLKVNQAGMRERIQNFEQDLAPFPTVVREQVSKKDGYLETPGLEPKNLTEDQYLSLSPDERNRLKAVSKKQTAETLEAIHTDAAKSFARAMGERGQTQVQEAKAWYTGNKKKLDKVFKTNPEKRAEFNADPVAFSKKYMNDSNNNDLFGKPVPKEERDLIKEGVGDADPTKAAEAVVNKDIEALEAELDKAKTLSAEKEQALVDFNTQVHNGNMMRMSKTDRSSVMINYLASIREDRKIYQQMIQSMPVFLETGMWSLAGETLKVNQANSATSRSNSERQWQEYYATQEQRASSLTPEGNNFRTEMFEKREDDGSFTFFQEGNYEMAAPAIMAEQARIATAVAQNGGKYTPELLQDLTQVSNIQMQIFNTYMIDNAEASLWKEILTATFAQDPASGAYTLLPNMAAYDENGKEITDPQYLKKNGKIDHFKSRDGRGSEISTYKMSTELGKQATATIFSAVVAQNAGQG